MYFNLNLEHHDRLEELEGRRQSQDSASSLNDSQPASSNSNHLLFLQFCETINCNILSHFTGFYNLVTSLNRAGSGTQQLIVSQHAMHFHVSASSGPITINMPDLSSNSRGGMASIPVVSNTPTSASTRQAVLASSPGNAGQAEVSSAIFLIKNGYISIISKYYRFI